MMEGEDNASWEYDVYTAIELPVSRQPGLMALSRLSRVSGVKTEWAIGLERNISRTVFRVLSEPVQLQHRFPLVMKHEPDVWMGNVHLRLCLASNESTSFILGVPAGPSLDHFLLINALVFLTRLFRCGVGKQLDYEARCDFSPRDAAASGLFV